MSKKYFERKCDGDKFVKYEEIKEGVILTIFDEDSGIPICNSHYKIFVSKEDLKRDYVPYDFRVSIDTNEQNILGTLLKDILYEMRNCGIEEDSVRAVEDCGVNIIEYIVNGDKINLDTLLSRDDLFEYQDAETAIAFLEQVSKVIMKGFALLRKQ